MIRILVYFVVVLVAVASTLVACGSSSDVELSAEDNGGRVELQKDQMLAVSLESNPTTGYRWEMTGQEDGILLPEGEAEFEARSDLVGSPGVETLRFKAVEAGETTLELVYHRPWETDVEPLETFTVNVVIR